MSVSPIDAWKGGGTSSPMARDGYRGPTREGKKIYAGGGSTRADKKAGKKYFGGSEGAGEKNKFGRERKKNIIRAGAKKNSGVNENTTHKKAYVQ